MTAQCPKGKAKNTSDSIFFDKCSVQLRESQEKSYPNIEVIREDYPRNYIKYKWRGNLLQNGRFIPLNEQAKH